MKYSILFLTFLLIWSALAVNGWQKYQRCIELQKQIDSANKQHGQINISDKDLALLDEIASLEKLVEPLKKQCHHFTEVFLEQKAAELDLASVANDHAVFGTIAISPFQVLNTRNKSTDYFKVLVPNDRPTAVEVDISHGKNQNKKHLHALPPGEYVLSVFMQTTEQPGSDSGLIKLEINLSPGPIKFEHEIKFSPTFSTGNASPFRHRIIKPGKSHSLIYKHFSAEKGKACFVQVSLSDQTKNE